MNGSEFVEILSRKLGIESQRELARVLGKNQVQISGWKKRELSAATIAGIVAGLLAQQITAEKLLPLLKADLGLEKNNKLALALGMSTVQLYSWKRRRTGLTAQQLSNAIKKASSVAKADAKNSTIRPIAEFVPIKRAGGGKGYQLFAADPKANRYFRELKEELVKHQGVYLFYDSRGHALYAGQTSKQGLWKEMNLAFNRNRATQSIKLVRHPKIGFQFKTTEKLDRQIRDTNLQLHDLAAYFSAFHVEDAMIDDVEALLVRAFPNDLLNSKMERFVAAKKRRADVAQRRKNKKALA